MSESEKGKVILKLIPTAILILFLYSCSSGGSGSMGGTPIYPGMGTSSIMYPGWEFVEAAYDPQGIAGVELCCQAVSLLEKRAGEVQGFLVPFNRRPVRIIFDNASPGKWSNDTNTIYVCTELAPLERRLIHEYAHACSMQGKIDQTWVLEMEAKTTEIWCGKEQVYKLSQGEFALLEEGIHYHIQASFGWFLTENYREDMMKKIILSPSMGRDSVIRITGQSWEQLLFQWQVWNESQ